MKNGILATRFGLSALAALQMLAAGSAVAAPLTPELAAKREMVRKQQEQRITPEKRKAAVDNLKAERVKIYNAKQAAKKANAGAGNN